MMWRYRDKGIIRVGLSECGPNRDPRGVLKKLESTSSDLTKP